MFGKIRWKITAVIVMMLCIYTGIEIADDLKKFDYFEMQYRSNSYFHLVDNFDDTMDAHRNDENFTVKLQKINEMLNQADNYTFIECSVGSGYIEPDVPLPVKVERADSGMQKVNVCSVSQNIMSIFPLSFYQGEFFEKEDFYHQSNLIPVLLGADFKNQFQLGDRFACRVRGMDYTFEVKGILAQSNEIIYFNRNVILDDYIIIPFEVFDDYDENQLKTEYVFRTLLDKNNGIIYCHNQAGEKELNEDMGQLCQQLNLPPYLTSVTYDEIKRLLIMKFIFKLLILALLLLAIFYIIKRKCFVKEI